MRHPLFAICAATLLSTAYAAEPFALKSPDFTHKGKLSDKHVYTGFGCTGGNTSPALTWSNPPAGTRSFALLVHDPDAPTGGSGWWHWVVLDIPATARQLPAGAGKADGSALPAGASQWKTDFGGPGWGGPCPPVGNRPHSYHFTLHALKVEKLELPADGSTALVGYMVNANSLGKATLTGTFGR